jgi:hypothetical protein
MSQTHPFRAAVIPLYKQSNKISGNHPKIDATLNPLEFLPITRCSEHSSISRIAIWCRPVGYFWLFFHSDMGTNLGPVGE